MPASAASPATLGPGSRSRGHRRHRFPPSSPRWVTEILRGLMAKKMLSLHATFKRAVPSWPAGMVTLAEPSWVCRWQGKSSLPLVPGHEEIHLAAVDGGGIGAGHFPTDGLRLARPRGHHRAGQGKGLAGVDHLDLHVIAGDTALAVPRREAEVQVPVGGRPGLPIARVLVSREVRLGRVRSGTLVGATKRNSGRLPSSTMVAGLLDSVPRSICSQV